MIQVADKIDCCGCEACKQVCPKQCIEMNLQEGFYYPQVDSNRCIECGLCEKVCPIKHIPERKEPKSVLAAKHHDEVIRFKSSSGGIFTAIAKRVIECGGVVFGAKFNSEWEVVHSYTDNKEGLEAFRRSKYVQSRIGDSYQKAQRFLKDGRKVLFTGTPCQIAGLKCFLRKEYDNLLTVDVVCHGVPSPDVWKEYIKELRPKGAAGKNTVFQSLKNMPVLTGISFRDKTTGWQKYGFSAWAGATEGSDENSVFPPKESEKYRHDILQENVFMRGFLQDLYLRPSCHHCHFRNFRSGSDITIADFWGVGRIFPEWNDDKGISLIIQKNCNVNILEFCDVEKRKIPQANWNLAFKGNPSLFEDTPVNINSDQFWLHFREKANDLSSIITSNTTFPKQLQMRANLDHLLLKLHLYNLVKKIVTYVRKS